MQVDYGGRQCEGVNHHLPPPRSMPTAPKSTIDMKMDLPGMMNLTLQMDLGYGPPTRSLRPVCPPASPPRPRIWE